MLDRNAHVFELNWTHVHVNDCSWLAKVKLGKPVGLDGTDREVSWVLIKDKFGKPVGVGVL